MADVTYTQPNTVSNHECEQIILGVVRGMGPITEEECTPVVQKAIDMLHRARIDEAMLALVVDGRVEICGVNEKGELVFQKNVEST